MKQIIQLSESDIKDAIRTYVEANGVSLEGKDATIDLVAGRAPRGHTAEVELVPEGTKKAKKPKSAPKPTPVVEEEDDPETETDSEEENEPTLDEAAVAEVEETEEVEEEEEAKEEAPKSKRLFS